MRTADIERLAVRVLEHLHRLPDATELSTYEAVGQVDDTAAQSLEFEGWFTLNRLIWDKVGMFGVELDDSAYTDMVVGLPHHIPYVVRHKTGVGRKVD